MRIRDPRIRGESSSELVAVARIIKERGIRGDVRALPLSDAANSISSHAEVEILSPSGSRQTRMIRSIRVDNARLILSFEGIDRREDAALLRDAVVQMKKKFLPALRENEYYHWQIVGLDAVTSAGDKVGKVVEIMETESNDIFVVRGSCGEFLIPAVKAMVAAIDLDAGTITINPIEGLLG